MSHHHAQKDANHDREKLGYGVKEQEIVETDEDQNDAEDYGKQPRLQQGPCGKGTEKLKSAFLHKVASSATPATHHPALPRLDGSSMTEKRYHITCGVNVHKNVPDVAY